MAAMPLVDGEGRLTRAGIELLETTYAVVELDSQVVFVDMFEAVFDAHPSVLQLFPFKDEKSLGQRASMLKKHALGVVKGMEGLLGLLASDLATAKEVLQAMGKRHEGYGVLPSHFPVVGEALLWALAQKLGSAWTSDANLVWEAFYHFIATGMISGMKSQPAAPLPVPTAAAASEGGEGGLSHLAVSEVKRSWGIAKANVQDVAVATFLELFRSLPDTALLFKFDQGVGVSEESLRSHALGVFHTVDKCIDMLGDGMGMLSSMLKNVGQRHASYGTFEAHFPALGASLMKALEQELGSRWTPELKAAWGATWGFITGEMLAGIRAGNPDLPNVAGPDGVLTEAGVEVIRRTWKLVSKQAQKNGERMFLKVFDIRPDILALFPFHQDENIEQSAGLRRHSFAVMTIIGRAVASLGKDMSHFNETLRDLGKTHAALHVDDSHFTAMGTALLWTIELALGSEWTPEVKQAWTRLYDSVSAGIKAGMGTGPALPVRGVADDAKASPPPAMKKANSLKSPLPATPKHRNSAMEALSLAPPVPPKSGGGPPTVDWSGSINAQGVKEVKRTWAIVMRNAQEVATRLYFRLFKVMPGAVQLFPFRDDAVLEESVGLRAHALNVFHSIGKCVDVLGDDMDMLSMMLRALGERHAMYRTVESHFPVLGDSLLLALEWGLGAQWNLEVFQAWSAAYDFVATEMIHGLREGYADLEPAAEEGVLTQERIKIVRRTWGVVMEDTQSNGERLFQKMFEIAPDLLKMFPFKGDDVKDSASLRAHASALITTVGSAVGMLSNMHTVTMTLRSLGEEHAKYGVVESHFVIINVALFWMLEVALGEQWTPDVIQAWKALWEVVIKEMSEGL
eukprot:CAMPEP_0182901382 /NCGR_PEP_ID=MMETSP0034_2-20130328/29609_1 /TAXON_ID=156128 /ORGANISM="Nephroselmis pyriformis, Strain CCMP717" /LENGTH=853 /DNA_ID=CAMNT_0025035791 /DNA_START=131 /DNA_END=2688 /DNA_ORIENTATION=+